MALTELDGVDSIVGDEAHIRSKTPKGPRHDPSYPIDKVDGYDNLILLCKAHHKLVDDNPEVFDTDMLEQAKERHELRVAKALDPKKVGYLQPLVAIPIATGTELVRLAFGAHAYSLDNDHPRTPEEGDLIAGFLQDVQDWTDISDDIGASGRVQAAIGLHEEMEQLRELGLVVLAGTAKYRMPTGLVFTVLGVHVRRIPEDSVAGPEGAGEPTT
ncbi:MAG TPA: hypothetical protein VHB02_04890 [Acidimicrobiales bacterium]|nr:hypothetical protein [Acidimicrobiales bacterium]